MLFRTATKIIILNFTHTHLIEIQQEISMEALELLSHYLDDEMQEEAINQIEKQNSAVVLFMNFILGLIFNGGLINLLISAIFKRDRHILDTV